MLMISKWNDVIYLIWIDVVVEKCHFSCFSNLDFCSWWGSYKRFYGIVVLWKYVLVNIIYDKYIFVGFFFLCICMVCCNGVIVYWQYVYVCVMNGWNGCFYLLCCMYTISYHVVQTRWFILYININGRSVKREEGWNNLTNPVWVFCFDYIGCFVRVYQLVVLNNIWNVCIKNARCT